MTTRILICDDSGMARKQMTRALPKDWDTEINFAEHGLDALEKLKAGLGDILFLDLNMPDLDGYGVLEAINKDDLPVLTVVVSGDIQPQARERVKKMGAIDFIKKPTSPEVIVNLLQDYGLYRPGEDASSTLPHSNQKAAPDSVIDLNDFLQEIANIAMGRAADLLARLLNVFIKLPVPRVAMIERSELSMALAAASNDDQCSVVCQGFTGAGVAGEALLLFSDSNFTDMARLLRYEEAHNDSLEVEVLMDMSSILFGAFLKGLGDQMDLKLGLGHPTVLGQHQQVNQLLEHHSNRSERLLSIEINYQIEDHEIACDLLVLLTEDSIPFLEKNLYYLAE
ncbi:response regulator [Marinobacter caseinilyticus]|uniref:response regulator n=1 Tax=Marinobacter caseinilyticus TaxID=2692195 RepID=UPI001407F8B6|nr:response regulator [Marinobacter caseinilyticus]